MRILLDECIDERFRHRFIGHDCQTVRFAGLAGLKNGQLLAAAEALYFNILITVDQGIPYQQNLALRRIAVLVLYAVSNRLENMNQMLPAVLETIATIKPGQVEVLR